MADQGQGTQGGTSMERSGQTSPERTWPRRAEGPFSLMRRFSEDMDRLFDTFLGGSAAVASPWTESMLTATGWPAIEVAQEGNKLVVQADVPGLKKEDVKVEVKDNALCISGERQAATERNEGGYYRSERSYGSFCRTVPLPSGAKLDSASATFENGVLRVEIDAPPETQPRKIDVREGRSH
jgi:HSP20 family protein